jgi:hypothetical protein
MKKNNEKLNELLKGLCSTEEDYKILDNLCKETEEFTESTIVIKNSEFIYKTDKITLNKKLPQSFIDIADIVSQFSWESSVPYSGFRILEDGYPNDNDWLFDDMDEEEIDKISYLSGAFDSGQNGIFFDLNRKLLNGEYALGFMGHDSCEWSEVKSVDHLNYKQILLRLISDEALDTNYVEEIYY